MILFSSVKPLFVLLVLKGSESNWVLILVSSLIVLGGEELWPSSRKNPLTINSSISPKIALMSEPSNQASQSRDYLVSMDIQKEREE